MSALPTPRQLRYLVTLADQLNFTRAAELCFVSQSTLSAGIKELESLMGVQLVERDRQNVALTPAGEALIERARGLLSASEDLVQSAQTVSKPMQGLRKLGVIPTIAPFMLPVMLPQIRDQFPLLKLALREDLTENLLARLRSRQLDFALIALPYDTEGLTVEPLFFDEFWLVAKKGDPAIAQTRVTLPAKVTERLLLLEEGHCLREHSLQACKRSEIASAEGIEATSLLTLVQMAESGMGLALLPEMAIKSNLLHDTSLMARPLAEPVPKRTIALVARQSSAHLSEFAALAELIKGIYRKAARHKTPAAKKRVRHVS